MFGVLLQVLYDRQLRIWCSRVGFGCPLGALSAVLAWGSGVYRVTFLRLHMGVGYTSFLGRRSNLGLG